MTIKTHQEEEMCVLAFNPPFPSDALKYHGLSEKRRAAAKHTEQVVTLQHPLICRY